MEWVWWVLILLLLLLFSLAIVRLLYSDVIGDSAVFV